MIATACRACSQPLAHVFADLGMTPLANAFVDPAKRHEGETLLPLRAMVCGSCLLVQLDHIADPRTIFDDYAYYSSWSASWLRHSEQYAQRMTEELGLDERSLVLEIASNDGYLLQYFAASGVPVLGVEPAANVAKAAEGKGIPTVVDFFGRQLADTLAEERAADLIVANNVLAHVPDLHDFVGGISRILAPRGRATIEVPHVARLVSEWQFDTIYHEHYSYFSMVALEPLLAQHSLRVVDAEELPTHGGSLRLHLVPDSSPAFPTPAVEAVRRLEQERGLGRLETYVAFGRDLPARKRAILKALVNLKDEGLRIAGYGAPAKGNTLLNYCGIGTDMVDFTVDANPVKQGTLLPGTGIPVMPPSQLESTRPDVVWLLPWNLREELLEDLHYVRDWGGRFFVTHPEPQLL